MKKSKLPKLKLFHLLILFSVLLTLIGILFVFESSVSTAFRNFNDPYHFVRQQLIWFGIGIVGMIVAFLVPTKFLQKISPFIYIGGLALIATVFIPGLGLKVNGAYRWIKVFGVNIQPVEIFKLSVTCFFASWMSKHQRILPFIFLTILPASILLLQPDLGSTLIVISIAFGLYFIAGGKLLHLLGLGTLGIIAIALTILTQPYRLKRLTTFINPQLDPLGASFHIRQITLALGSGGWLGRGVGLSRQKFSYIPEPSTDSIFAIVAEEVGFLGSVTIMLLFLAYLYVGLQIVKNQSPGSFEQLLAAGIIIWIASQAILNLSAVVALVPLTGLPLPFFSYGGSSLVMVLSATGILSKIANKK